MDQAPRSKANGPALRPRHRYLLGRGLSQPGYSERALNMPQEGFSSKVKEGTYPLPQVPWMGPYRRRVHLKQEGKCMWHMWSEGSLDK